MLLSRYRFGEAPGEDRNAVAIHSDSMELAHPRSVGVEQVGLMPLLEDLGVNGALRAAVAGRLHSLFDHLRQVPELRSVRGVRHSLASMLASAAAGRRQAEYGHLAEPSTPSRTPTANPR